MPLDAGQRVSSSSNSKIPDSQQHSAPNGSPARNVFRYLPDSMDYHAEHLNASSSQVSDASQSGSFDAPAPMISTFVQGASLENNFKVPSFPSISSIMRNSSDENASSLAGIGEAQSSLSQFFLPTQDSPPQARESPIIPMQTPQVHPSPQIPMAVHTVQPVAPPTPEPVSKYIPIRVLEEQRKQREAEAEIKRKAEHDSFTELPEGLRRRWAMEEKAHKMFEDLRKAKVEITTGRGIYDDPALDDFMFGTKTRLDPDGVRRVIRGDDAPKRATSEHGDDEGEVDTSGGDSRKRASTAPLVRDTKDSASTVISNSQPSYESHPSAANDTTTKHRQEDSAVIPRRSGSSNLHSWQDESQQDQATPLRQTKEGPVVIPSSIPSTVNRSLETPYPTRKLASNKAPFDQTDSVPETSPTKPTQTEDFRTARETFPAEESDYSSPVPAVHGRRRAKNAFVASSVPNEFTQGAKRLRPPQIQDVSEDEEDGPASGAAPAGKRRRTACAAMGTKAESDAMTIVSMTDLSESSMEAHRVLARFKDAKMNYFPATVLEAPVVVGDQEASMDSEVLVQFDDGLRTMVALKHIRRLELREGDCIKIWMEAYKRPIFVVQRVEHDPNGDGNTDIAGNNVVVVVPKSGGGSKEELRLPMDKVYLTGKLFAQLGEDRRYLFTVISRHRVHNALAGGGSRHVSSSPGVTRGGTRALSSLFENMVFAISGGSSSSRTRGNPKESLSEMIAAHGGRVVEDGLHDLFDPIGEVDDLALKPEFAGTTFCAVLADEYSRRVKYLQALALGLPCLATKWIEHCVKQVSNLL